MQDKGNWRSMLLTNGDTMVPEYCACFIKQDELESRVMMERVTIGQLNIAKVLSDLLENEIAPGTGVSPAHFWSEMESVLREFVPRNRALLLLSLIHISAPTRPY